MVWSAQQHHLYSGIMLVRDSCSDWIPRIPSVHASNTLYACPFSHPFVTLPSPHPLNNNNDNDATKQVWKGSAFGGVKGRSMLPDYVERYMRGECRQSDNPA